MVKYSEAKMNTYNWDKLKSLINVSPLYLILQKIVIVVYL